MHIYIYMRIFIYIRFLKLFGLVFYTLYVYIPCFSSIRQLTVNKCHLDILFYYTFIYTGGADKSLARPTSRCILFGGENISYDASLVIYINSTNIPPIMIINRIYENQNLLSL